MNFLDNKMGGDKITVKIITATVKRAAKGT